jgi:DNA-binding MarR family transcriptional regulator/GNAT superfamily N-acetyltransferase
MKSTTSTLSPLDPIATIRAFNRFYTNTIGVLHGGLLDTPYSLTEARVIFELAQHDATEVVTLRRTLDIDAGYLSHILARFQTDGLITKERSTEDRRRQIIHLTDQGRAVFALLDARSIEENRAILSALSPENQRRLLGSMKAIQDILEGAPQDNGVVIRQPEPGEYGWVVQRHGAVYSEEYGWDETFEALVAHIVAEYIGSRDPQRENAWIAEVEGKPAGCIFCVQRDEKTAQLRLLLVEPTARGRGIGGRLVQECLRFARRAGYESIMLWTNDVLVDARHIYQRAGFQLTEEENHHSFGHDLVGQNWWRSLKD